MDAVMSRLTNFFDWVASLADRPSHRVLGLLIGRLDVLKIQPDATAVQFERMRFMGANIRHVPVPAGEYSLWLIPHESGEWTVGLDSRVRRFHTQRPDSTGFAVRIPATPAAGEHVERARVAGRTLRNLADCRADAYAGLFREIAGVRLSSHGARATGG